MNATTAFQGELMLAGWSETHTGGSKVTFWLPDAEALDVFRSMTVRKGNTAGQRFMAVLVEIGDDEQPKQVADKPKGGVLSRDAALICANVDFQNFVADKAPGLHMESENDAQAAAAYVRLICRITSRAELDHSPAARQLFGQLMEDYRAWRQGR